MDCQTRFKIAAMFDPFCCGTGEPPDLLLCILRTIDKGEIMGLGKNGVRRCIYCISLKLWRRAKSASRAVRRRKEEQPRA